MRGPSRRVPLLAELARLAREGWGGAATDVSRQIWLDWKVGGKATSDLSLHPPVGSCKKEL